MGANVKPKIAEFEPLVAPTKEKKQAKYERKVAKKNGDVPVMVVDPTKDQGPLVIPDEQKGGKKRKRKGKKEEKKEEEKKGKGKGKEEEKGKKKKKKGKKKEESEESASEASSA